MTTITRYSKPQKRSSKFTQRKAAPNSVRLAEEVKAYRKAKLAFRVYASIGDFAKALKELMKLDEITRFSVHQLSQAAAQKVLASVSTQLDGLKECSS